MQNPKKNILIALTISFTAFLIGLFFAQSSESFLSETSLKIIGTIMAVAFLANGIYGAYSGRVYGRNWQKYWGGWIYKTENPYFYWSYVFMWLFVAIILFLSCANIFF